MVYAVKTTEVWVYVEELFCWFAVGAGVCSAGAGSMTGRGAVACDPSTLFSG